MCWKAINSICVISELQLKALHHLPEWPKLVTVLSTVKANTYCCQGLWSSAGKSVTPFLFCGELAVFPKNEQHIFTLWPSNCTTRYVRRNSWQYDSYEPQTKNETLTWISKLWYSHTLEYYRALGRNEPQLRQEYDIQQKEARHKRIGTVSLIARRFQFNWCN